MKKYSRHYSHALSVSSVRTASHEAAYFADSPDYYLDNQYHRRNLGIAVL
ncbi:MAG: hypothetical protein NT077_03470 [Candidatus Taylorbacteria bacterium]|nr:hypothetical protein [Candidatus Taylorbacteria bacterium]